MSSGELGFLYFVIMGFAIFGCALAWGSWYSGKR